MTAKIGRWAPLPLLALSACAPETSGPDQAKDINYTLTASADEALDDVAYPKADEAMEALVGPNKLANGCALGLVMNGQVVYLKGYGLANEQAGIPWDVNTASAVGSVSKTFTALAILRLAEMGQLHLGDRFNDHLSPSTLYGFQTLSAALTHTSGIGGATKEEAFSPNWGPGPDEAAYPVEHPMAHPRYAYDAFAPYQVLASPSGTTNGLPNGVYSNVGYTLLGAVIDSITASRSFAPEDGYERFVWYEVARGANLSKGLKTFALGHSWRDSDIPHFARGYDDFVLTHMWDGVGSVEGWEGPSGGWTMTIGDLTRFVAAVQKREIVSRASWAAATAPKSWVNGRPYGYGMWITPVLNYPGAVELSHGGDIEGYSALWASFEGIDDHPPLGVALQCNQIGSDVLEDTANDLFWDYVSDLLTPEFPLGTRGEQHFALDLGRASLGRLSLGSLLGDGLELVATRDGGVSRMEIRGSLGSYPLESAKLSGTALDATLAGYLDTRIAGASGVCAATRNLGLPCRPCSDGSETCLPIQVRGVALKAKAKARTEMR
jgi:CubicO group peptidase (beta-lactamase class C family)